MRLFICLLCLIVSCIGVDAQIFKGNVTDKNGNTVEGATLYIREVAQGCVANENGLFQITLPAGTYTCEVSSLGYGKKIVPVKVTEGMGAITLQLEGAVYMLKEVRVTARGEDPAYYIMRNAIAWAPFYQHQVKKYSAEAYVKGSFKVLKVPGILKWADKEGDIKKIENKLYLLESVNEVEFKAPNTYKQKVIAYSTSLPPDMNPESGMVGFSGTIYNPEFMDVISPLNPRAFAYYRFIFEECYQEDGITINRIRIEPKKNNAKLLRGWIYIAENTWNVMRYNLKIKVTGITLDIKCAYHEVKPMAFLPTSYEVDCSLGLLGLKMVGKYYSSWKYTHVEALPIEKGWRANAVKPDTLFVLADIEPKVIKSKKELKREKEIEELTNKEELTNRDAYKLAKWMQKSKEPGKPDTISPLEIRESRGSTSVVVDTIAVKNRDSLYWKKVRTLELADEEARSYQRKDSLRPSNKKVEITSRKVEIKNDTAKHSDVVDRIIWGGDCKLSSKWRLGWGGLYRAMSEYNFVDGFWLGQKLTLSKNMGKHRHLKLIPSAYYATARKTMIWDFTLHFDHNPMKNGLLTLHFGDQSADFNGQNGMSRIENTLASIMFAENYMKLYRKRYASADYAIDAANGLRVKLGGSFEKRTNLENNISYSVFGGKPRENTPVREGGVGMPVNTSTKVYAQIEYTPEYHYRIRNGKKYYEYSDFPTFSIYYEKGIPNGATFHSDYDRINLGIRQKVDFGIFDALSYQINTGLFLSDKEIYFPDYKHFNTASLHFTTDEFEGGYFLADYYGLSTNDKWLQAGINYTSSYLLLKRLPFLQRYWFNEAVHARYLWTPSVKHYTEWGYSVGIREAVRIGVFVGFEQSEYKGVGFTVSIPFLNYVD